MSYPITDIEGIDGDAAARLKSAGIRSTARLLEAAAHAEGPQSARRQDRSAPEKNLLCWANMADRMRIKGISKEYAELLQAAGVETVQASSSTAIPPTRRRHGRAPTGRASWCACCRRKRPWRAGSARPRRCRSKISY